MSKFNNVLWAVTVVTLVLLFTTFISVSICPYIKQFMDIVNNILTLGFGVLIFTSFLLTLTDKSKG